MMNDLQKIVPLPTKWLGRSHEYVAAIGSTNQELSGRTAVPHGHLLLADYQSAGRGRLNRQWIAPAKSSLLMSLALQLDWPSEQAGWLTMMLGLAVTEGIEAETGLVPVLKWPNDVMLQQDEAWQKVCGLLVEVTFGANGRLHSAILGCGLNVNIPTEELPPSNTPATSLQVQAGQPIARVPLLHKILQALENHIDRAQAGQSPKQAWSQKLITLGQLITVTNTTNGDVLSGVATAVDEWGHLILQTSNDTQHTIRSGDVTLRTPKQD